MTDDIMPITEKPGFKVDAAIDPQILTAKAYPRDALEAVNRIIAIISSDEELASSCYYTRTDTKDKDGKAIVIQGPSVRLAEVFLSEWGNMKAGTRVISNDGRQIVVEGYCWDLEKNNNISMQVSKSIINSKGNTYSPTMQQTTIMAAGSIAYRNAIFKIIPLMYIDKVYKVAMEKVAIFAKNIAYVEKAIKNLEKYNVMPMQVLGYFSKQSLKELTPEEVQEMIGIGISLREGNITSAEAFTRNAPTFHNKDGVVIENGSRAEALLSMEVSE